MESTGKSSRRISAVSIDSIADASLQTFQTTKGSTELHCDWCGEPIEGEPAGHGLLMWRRGDDMRLDEEPALCVRCSTAIGVTALVVRNVEEEGG
jgi:hypothetical protein